MPHSRRSRRKFTREAAWSRLSATAQPDWSSSGEYLVAGKKVAAFTNAEEIAVKLQDTARFMLETPLLERGAQHVAAPNFTEMQGSERLVTGQSPASARGVGVAVVALLEMS